MTTVTLSLPVDVIKTALQKAGVSLTPNLGALAKTSCK